MLAAFEPLFENNQFTAFAKILSSDETGHASRVLIADPDLYTSGLKTNRSYSTCLTAKTQKRFNATGIVLVLEGDAQQSEEPNLESEIGNMRLIFDHHGIEPIQIANAQAVANQLPKELVCIPALFLLG
ncbi:DUF3394 domain-containing protein [Tateyamaria sp.]|uniref:DUF3394 domain-containing protein n=1 Tax=Tateyamaria sp. TaxID=1929288 RepID=UPI00329DB9D6